jgi:cytochrome c biogenesis protein CcmG/thiol:disulfide interchange protein DsbE
MRKLLFFAPLLVAFGLGFFLWRGLSLNPQELPSALIGEPVPAFELPSLENPDRLLTQDILKGRVSLLNVWATWCTACKVEHPFLMELAENRWIPIIGLDYKDNRDAALKWQSDLGNPYQVTLFDSEGRLGLDLGVYGVPETFLIDKDGIIRLRHAGIVNEQVWQDKFRPLFEQYQQQ